MPSQEEIDRLDSLLNPRPAANSNLLNATGSPDEAARTLSNSVATGTPFAVGNMNPKEFNAEVETNKAIATSNSDPVVARYLGSNDFAAHVSRDDTDILASISPLLKPFMRFEKGLAQETWGVLKDVGQSLADIPGLIAGSKSALDPEQKQRIMDLMSKAGVPEEEIEQRARSVELAANRQQLEQNLLFAAPMAIGSPILGALKMGSKALQEATGIPAEVSEGIAMAAGAAVGIREIGRPAARPTGGVSIDLKPYHDTGEVPLPGVSAESDGLLIHEAKTDNEKFQDALKEVKKSATLERSPDAFKAFIDEAVQGKEVSIPADAVMEVLGDKAPEQFAWLPDFEEQMRVAGTTGGDIKIPLSDWLSHGVELADAFKEDIRLRPEGLTLHEAEELEKTPPEAYQNRGPDIIGYHGSMEPLQGGPDPEKAFAGRGLFFSDSPELANRFAQGMGHEGDPGLIFGEDKPEEIKGWVARVFGEKEAERIGKMMDRFEQLREPGPEMTREQSNLANEINDELRKVESSFSGSPNVTRARLSLGKTHTVDFGGRFDWEKEREGIDYAKEHGFDSVRFINSREKGAFYTIFDKSQIKPEYGPEAAFRSASAAATNESWLNPLFKDYGLEAQPTEGAKPLFTGPQDLGMPKPMWNQYQKKIQDLRDAQDEAAIKYAQKEIAKRQTAEWKAEESRQRDQLTTDLRYRPDIMADTFLRTGVLGLDKRPRFQLDANIIEKRFGKEVADGLPRGSAVKRGGVDPGDVAAVFGFHSGDALVNNLYLLENKRKTDGQSPAQHFKATVDAQLSRAMDQYAKVHGDLESNIIKEAREAVGTGGQADLLADEMFALQKNWDETQRSITREQTEAQIKEDFNKLSWRDAMRSTDFDRAAGKAGRQTEMALLKGDIQTAFQAKQRQFISVLMAREARALEKQVKRGERLFDTYAKNPALPGVEQEYTDRVHQLLDGLQYGIRRAPDELLRATEKQSLEQFVQDKLNDGQEVYVARQLLDPMASGRTMRNFNYDAINVSDWHDLYDSIKSLDTNGREVKKLTIAGQTMDLDLKAQEASTQLAGMKDKPIIDPRGLQGVTKWWAKGRRTAQDLKVLQIRPEVMALWFDRLDPNGVFSKMFQSISDAYGKKLDLDRESSNDLKGLPKHITFNGMNEPVENTIGLKYPGRDQEVHLTKGNVLGLALHMGARENWDKVAKGWRVDPDDLTQFVHDHMTKPDWDWVQAVWDIMAKRFPDAEEVQRRMTGVGVRKVEPQVVRTPFGDYKGGYIRLKPDPIANDIPVTKPKGLFGEASFYNPTPAGSFMKERTGKIYAPVIDAHDIVGAIGETNHWIALREPLREAVKFYTHPDIRDAIVKKMGREYYDSIMPWLEDIASDGTGSRLENDRAWGTMHNIAGMLRRNWTIAELGYRASTVAKHGLGALSNSINQVGAIPLGRALIEIHTPGSTVASQILEESAMMRNRKRTMDRDMMDVLRRSYGENTVAATLQHYAFGPVAWGDYQSAMPTYWAEKKKAILRGMTESEAIAQGEKAVRLAHGGGTVVDLPALLRTNNEAMRLAFVAMTFWNATYNKYAMSVKEVQEKFQYNNANAKLSRAAIASLMVPLGLALGEELVSPQPSDPDESWGWWGAKMLARPYLSSVPFARQAAHVLANPSKKGVFEVGKMTPVADLFEASINTLMNAWKVSQGDKVYDKQKIRHLIESTTLGGIAPVPGAGQAGMIAQYLWNVEQGADKMENPTDVIYGILNGRSGRQPRRR